MGCGRPGAREVGKALGEGWMEAKSVLPDRILVDFVRSICSLL